MPRLRRRAGPGNGAGDGSQILDNLPAVLLSELKPGDAIVVSTTQGSTPGRVTAIMLLAGVEPLLTASSTATRDILSGWSAAPATQASKRSLTNGSQLRPQDDAGS